MPAACTRLDAELKRNGIPIHGVSPQKDGGWRVDFRDEATQAKRDQAAAIVAVFNPDDPAHEQAELDAAVMAALDTDRITSAVLWALGDTLNAPPMSKVAYQALRAKVINAYKSQPWK